MGFDAPYAPHAASTIASVIRHAPGAHFRFLILYAEMPVDLRAELERCAPGHTFVWIKISSGLLPSFHNSAVVPHINHTTLFRLGLESVAPADAKRVLYLDADLIVQQDVREIARADLGGHPLGAIVDAIVDEAEFARNWGLPPGGFYFNAGVLVIDLEKVRAEKLFSKAMAFLAEQGPRLQFIDQDAVNWTFWRRWKMFDTRWNAQRLMVVPHNLGKQPDFKTLRGAKPAIVHYTGPEKPWLRNAWHPWSWLYWDNLARTPFFKKVSREQGVGLKDRLRLWLRWLRRRNLKSVGV